MFACIPFIMLPSDKGVNI